MDKRLPNTQIGKSDISGETIQHSYFRKWHPPGQLLFNIPMESVVTLQLRTGTKILCYANDIAIISTGSGMDQKPQEALTTVANKCEKLGLKINHNKTKAMIFGTNPQLPLKISGNDIGWTNSHTYLGVCFDHHLSFKQHVAAIKVRATSK